ncbi:hypothetical protein EMIHUDRAFT_122416 [Emiliania huxleyi CCMP1516]|uniref:NADH dehydrogenase [ubiquinone] 1 beta subcomplex subunit 2, mitochondrial n=2 Tax=Emiliania huxleyi TaxID=2903 RepID=A0A0D3KNI2_EMIH1|nr:hypothetical protein EMIHUDRAFT_122416 [Emiliania huxleyi CCMP1516]EOD37317.1 hypothetical protein EMIHUDRAFT_122416 [Emiliania huxleyi CCMP1516]|eukprot:XP_005789746.1 hypothetical protein EMIHUDRAFT_122416 [Emiliania huxleyi CCMP1516]
MLARLVLLLQVKLGAPLLAAPRTAVRCVMLGAARATRVAHVLRTTQRHASHGPKTYGKGEFRGFTPPHVPMWQKRVGEGFATAAWLWFFWRCYHDGGHLVGM